jgi:hypothetical protein
MRFDLQRGTVKYADYFGRNSFPQAPNQLCQDGGLKSLLNKMWGKETVGKIYLDIHSQFVFNLDDSAQKVYDDLKSNKGTTNLDWKPSVTDNLK